MSSQHHQALIARFAAVCHTDTRIAAAFVGGSRGADTADEHADSDLYLVLHDDTFASFFAERHRFMAQFGDPVFLEDFNGFGFDMLLFIYADGVEGELVLAHSSGFEHIPSGPFQVLLDRDGILPNAAFPPIKQPTQEEQREHMRWNVNWFWRDLSQFSRYLARGQLWSAYAHLEMARHTCLGLVRARHTFQPALGSYHKIEFAVDAADLAPFQATFCRIERNELVAAMHRLLDIYRHVVPGVAATHDIEYPTKLAHTVLKRLEQASTMTFEATPHTDRAQTGTGE
jgi:hypothetical protein